MSSAGRETVVPGAPPGTHRDENGALVRSGQMAPYLLDHWIWNLAPLGLVKWVANRHGLVSAIHIGPDKIGPFYTVAVGGVLIRAKSGAEL
jgi:hypothetical protein